MPPKVKRIMTQPIVSAAGARRAASAPGAAHRASNGVQRGSGQLAFRRMASANVARPPAGVGALAAVLAAAAAAAACCRTQVPLPGVLVCSLTAVDEWHRQAQLVGAGTALPAAAAQGQRWSRCRRRRRFRRPLPLPPSLPRSLAPLLQNLIFRFLQSRQKIQIWLYEQTDLRVEGRIIVRAVAPPPAAAAAAAAL